MSTLRAIPPVEPPPNEPPPPRPPSRPHSRQPVRWALAALAVGFATIACVLVWWVNTADVREIQALPDTERLPLYQRTMANLRNVCDPAAPRSLRDFCHNEAELALKFRECAADQGCLELARRHLPAPHR